MADLGVIAGAPTTQADGSPVHTSPTPATKEYVDSMTKYQAEFTNSHDINDWAPQLAYMGGTWFADGIVGSAQLTGGISPEGLIQWAQTVKNWDPGLAEPVKSMAPDCKTGNDSTVWGKWTWDDANQRLKMVPFAPEPGGADDQQRLPRCRRVLPHADGGRVLLVVSHEVERPGRPHHRPGRSSIESQGSERMDLYRAAIVSGIAVGGTYALVAVGITQIFSVTRVLNFAHAGFTLWGAYLYAQFTYEWGWPVGWSAALTIAIVGVMGLVVGALGLPIREPGDAGQPDHPHVRPVPPPERDRGEGLGLRGQGRSASLPDRQLLGARHEHQLAAARQPVRSRARGRGHRGVPPVHPPRPADPSDGRGQHDRRADGDLEEPDRAR